jgi:hypothetical protein
MKRKRVFISFDFDKDKSLRDLLIGQSKNHDSPFEVRDHSLHEAAPERDWEEKAGDKIRLADRVIVLVGSDTHRAPGVLKEIKLARSLGKKIVQVIGYKDRPCKRVPGGGVLYRWTWENLKKILS